MIWGSANKIGCAANLRCRFKTWICQMTPPGAVMLHPMRHPMLQYGMPGYVCHCRHRTGPVPRLPACTPGNLLGPGGVVDNALWGREVPAPSSQWVTGTRPDGSPSYASYDPTGAYVFVALSARLMQQLCCPQIHLWHHLAGV